MSVVELFVLLAFLLAGFFVRAADSLFGLGWLEKRESLVGRGFERRSVGFATGSLLSSFFGFGGVRRLVLFPLSQGASECLARKGNVLDKQTGNH